MASILRRVPPVNDELGEGAAAAPPTMTVRPIACVMEQTLGSVTHYLNLRREEAECPGGLPSWLPINFRPTRVPWALAGSLLARKVIASVLDDVDGVFVHTMTLSLLSRDLFSRKPTVVSTDGTPASKWQMRAAYGLKPEGRLAAITKRAVYRGVLERAAGFVAWSNWAKASFVQDYRCREEDVAVIPPGLDLTHFAPGDRAGQRPRILFVGGDFERKGGDLLLKVFRERLRGMADLVLVTGADVPAEPGVEVHRNLTANSAKLRILYASCDVMALPTRADCYSLVCMEALASGMPVVTTRVGGIPDIVHEGKNGYLIEPDDGAALGDALESLLLDGTRRQTMGLFCREDARRRYDGRTNARRLFEFVRSRC
jgi:glycosyltransferase involved in cell wall biosynthesis